MNDENCFSKLSPEPFPDIPEGVSEILEIRTTHERIVERKKWLDSTVICPTCKAPGFNTGWGYWAHTCGAATHTDGEEMEACPSAKAA